MGLVSKTLSGLYNGVSQQAPTLRLETQGEEQVNCDSSLVSGLSKRPNTQYINELALSGTDVDNVYIHPIDRDSIEQYLVIFTNDDTEPIEIFTLDGTKCTVLYEGDTSTLKDYIINDDSGNLINSKKKIKATTVGDYTIIVNKERVTKMDVTSTTSDTTEEGQSVDRMGLAYVKTGYPETTYEITIEEGGTTYSVAHTTGTPSSTGVSYVKTDDIATALVTELTNTLPDTYNVDREGSVVVIELTDSNSDFTLKTTDSYGDQALYGIKGAVQKMSELPPQAPIGYSIKVEGDSETNFDNFYVKFIQDGVTGSGVWEESVALLDSEDYELVNSFDANTMPKQLVRTGNNEFTLSNVEWSDRLIGDDISNPYPSFVDKKINNVFFSKNRLGFLSGESFILSRSGDYFNFWAATATDVLDTDPVDNSVSTDQVTQLENVIPFAGALLTFSKKVQFMIHGGDTPITPETVIADPTTHFDTDIEVDPVGAGANIYFVVPSGSYSTIREYYVQKRARTNDAIDITAHVPKYLPSSVDKLISSSGESMLVALDSTTNEMFIYKYYWNNDEKVQSAWYKWSIPEVDKVLDGDIINGDLYLVVKRGLTFELLKVPLEETETGSLDFKIYLDRLTEVQGVYDSDSDTTSFTLPFSLNSENFELVNSTNGFPISAKITQADNTKLEVQGDYTETTYYVGLKYLSKYQFSKFYIKDNNGNPVIQGRLQLRNIGLTYDETGYIKLKVTRNDSRETEQTITNVVLGESILGENGLISGEKKVGVLGRNSQVSIKLESDSYLPFNVQTVSYEGIFTANSNFTQ